MLANLYHHLWCHRSRRLPAAESDKVDWFVVGGVPLSPHPFRLVNITDEWDVVLNDGVLISSRFVYGDFRPADGNFQFLAGKADSSACLQANNLSGL